MQPGLVAVLVDAEHVMRVRRVLARCDGVEAMRTLPLGRHTQVRIEIACGAVHADDIVAALEACARRGELGPPEGYVVEARAVRA